MKERKKGKSLKVIKQKYRAVMMVIMMSSTGYLVPHVATSPILQFA